MAKKENKPAVEAPVVDAGKKDEAQVIDPKNERFINKTVAGMTTDSKVLYFATLHDRYGKQVPEDLKDNPQFISGMNAIADAIAVTIAVEEAVNNDTVFHAIVNKNEKAYAALQIVAKEYGVDLPSMNLLPAPTQEQLAAAGMENADASKTGVVTIDKNSVSKEAQKKIAAEKKVVDSKPADSPTDVKDEKQLQASLQNIFIKGDRPVARAKKAVNFYRAYLKLQVKDNEDELKKIDAMTDIELLGTVKDIIGDCPYKDSGIAKHLRMLVAKSGTPIEAYCTLLRSAKNKKTGEMEATPELIAAICRTYVIWSCEAVIKEATAITASEERQLKKLDEKKNAEAIETIKKNIDAQNIEIEYANEVISRVVNPTSEVIDTLIDAYKADDDNENHKIAVMIVDAILKTMYPNENMEQYEAACVEGNVQQYAGCIINLFRDGAEQLPGYSESNIVELVKAKTEEKAEEETKN